ncbi:MAG: hypothetical protein PHU14_09285 [Methylovulum sp.]|nr:hypothetical protein [Methylovulum sp.]
MESDEDLGGGHFLDAAIIEQPPTAGGGRIRVVMAVNGHTHAGVPVAKGETIAVMPDERDWLAAHYLIEV